MENVNEKDDAMKVINMQRKELYYFCFLNKMSLLSNPLEIRRKRREIARLLTKENKK